METKRIEDIEKLKDSTVLTVGVFDGVHLGHRSIFKELKKISEEKKLLPLVLTFYPHPDRVLKKGETPLIQTLPQRIERIKEEGIENVIAVRFDKEFSELSAREFIDFLIEKLNMKGILVGENFRFGKGMEGNIELLRKIASERNFYIFTMKMFELDGKRISSSLVRKILVEGKVDEAIPLLGRPYSITGRVVRGHGIGKRIGIPTANVQTENELLPEGVFITRIHLKGKFFPSVTNIGRAPTLKNLEKSVETHIIDFEEDIVNEEVEIFFLKKIRNERKFENPEELKKGIEEDIRIAKNFFKKFD